MVDLKIWILTYPASKWDVDKLANDCRNAFSEERDLIDVEVFSNPTNDSSPLTNFDYLFAALSAQLIIGSDRLKRNFSISVLNWHLRQLGAYLASLVLLAIKKHRIKVSDESRRAAVIASGHELMWRKALLEPSKLYLFLEDDVVICEPKKLVEVTQALLELDAQDLDLVCDCSHSFSLSELGVEPPERDLGALQAQHLRVFDFPFTNSLASTYMSRRVLESIFKNPSSTQAMSGLGADLELAKILVQAKPAPHGCITQQRIFRQQSDYRSQRI
jgi:hypothetical protein